MTPLEPFPRRRGWKPVRSTPRSATLARCTVCLCLLLPTALVVAVAAAADDPLAAEVAHWSDLLHRRAAGNPDWAAVEQAVQPGLAGVTAALHDGRRLLALWRLAEVRVDIVAATKRAERPVAEGQDIDVLAADWRRLGPRLGGTPESRAASSLAGVRPALARAIGEAALPQVHELYQASLDYGRATTPRAGLHYLSEAEGQADLVTFCRTLAGAFPHRGEPPVRALDGELDGLDAEVQAAFHPPASGTHHADFVGASELLKEARELNAAGLRYGALLRYLQASLAARPLRPAPAPETVAPATLARQLEELDRRLGAGEIDHSIGRLFLEMAQAHYAAREAPGNAAIAAALTGDVLPRYFAALEPARGAPPPPQEAVVTVTLVRWPYT
jgi:hypothetical protein